ncbi:MAG: hypothetical protein WBR10_20685 [Candidatus Acidiferrum sp.]
MIRRSGSSATPPSAWSAGSSTDLAASRRALPIITAHALFDLYALLRLW